MTKGIFIAIDGPNGTGKSTALKQAAISLRESGYGVVETREPGGTPLAEKLRTLLLDSSNEMDTMTQLLLFNAARRSHIQTVIDPNVAEGRIVLCDRFLPSSLVFQGLKPDGSEDLHYTTILAAHDNYCLNRIPDLTIYLDAPIHLRKKRIANRAGAQADRFEEYDDAYDIAAANLFRKCASILPGRSLKIDASGPPSDVAAAVQKGILKTLHHFANEADQDL